MSRDEVMDILVGQLALEDPTQYGAIEITTGGGAPPLVQFRRRIVRDALKSSEDSADQDALTKVCAELSRTAQMVSRAATALWKSALIGERDRDLSPLISVVPLQEGSIDYASYLLRMGRLAKVVSRLDPRMLPTTHQAAREIGTLPDVFAFLGERRSLLRRLIHVTACPRTLLDSPSDTGAERGDEIASIYHTIVLGVELPEAPENWTMRDKPEYLRDTLLNMLSDLHHLTDASEIGWSQLISDADRFYRDELGGTR